VNYSTYQHGRARGASAVQKSGSPFQGRLEGKGEEGITKEGQQQLTETQ